MNIFYPKKYCFFEEDFFKYDLFNDKFYDKKNNFILFDNDTDINYWNEQYKNKKNITIFNRGCELNFVKKIIETLNPIIVFHLSDEFNIDNEYYNLYTKYSIKFLFNQYNHKSINYLLNHTQIPLGYAPNFIEKKSSIDNLSISNLENKIYYFSFIGAIKNDRKEMLYKFSNAFKKNYISAPTANWEKSRGFIIQPNEMFKIYKKTIFVPIGRGNKSLDCYRIYEAIVAEAIPVIVGNMDEIMNTFTFKPTPNIIIGINWDDAIEKCKKLLSSKQNINNAINYNKNWWKQQNIKIIEKIKEFL